MKNTCIHGLHVFLVCSNAGVRLTPTQVMDRLWQQHGLDLQMTPYGCTATSRCASPARFSVSITMMICYLALPCLQPPLCTHTHTHTLTHTLTHTHSHTLTHTYMKRYGYHRSSRPCSNCSENPACIRGLPLWHVPRACLFWPGLLPYPVLY